MSEEERIASLEAALQKLRSDFDEHMRLHGFQIPSGWAVGDRALHRTRKEIGVVRKIDQRGVHFEFPSRPGEVTAIFDAAWFRTRGDLLVKQPAA